MLVLPRLNERQIHIADVGELEQVVDLIDHLHACSLLNQMSDGANVSSVVFEARAMGGRRIWVLRRKFKLGPKTARLLSYFKLMRKHACIHINTKYIHALVSILFLRRSQAGRSESTRFELKIKIIHP
jgi:hypothetical protein